MAGGSCLSFVAASAVYERRTMQTTYAKGMGIQTGAGRPQCAAPLCPWWSFLMDVDDRVVTHPRSKLAARWVGKGGLQLPSLLLMSGRGCERGPSSTPNTTARTFCRTSAHEPDAVALKLLLGGRGHIARRRSHLGSPVTTITTAVVIGAWAPRPRRPPACAAYAAA